MSALFCHRCAGERSTTEQPDGKHRCDECGATIRCTDCGADFTADCGPGSVFVPASTT